MKRVIAAVGLAGIMALSTGCATVEDVEALSARVDGVSSAANAAQSAADRAQGTADNAQNAANAAQACCDANTERLERMFKKSMHK